MSDNIATPLSAHKGHRAQQTRNLNAKYFADRQSVREHREVVYCTDDVDNKTDDES